MDRSRDEAERRYVLCFAADASVIARRGAVRAALEIEARDVADWRVYDDELFVREVKVDLARNVSLGGRAGEAPAAEEALERMKACLRARRPDAQWTDVAFDGLFDAIAELNRYDDHEAARRARVFGLLIGVAVAVLVAWRVARWLALR